jgi:hypothetical protein
MDLNALFNSIITVNSSLVAVGIPFIIFIVANYNRKREQLLIQMKTYYSKFNAFKELIYYVFQIDFWKNKPVIRNYEIAVRTGNKEGVKTLINDYEFLSLYQSYKYISEQYVKDINDGPNKNFTYKEISKYKFHVNYIWYAIDCRTDFIKEIESEKFNEIDGYNSERINRSIRKIGIEYPFESLSIEKIAYIAGDIEVSVIDPLCNLAWDYERPLESIVKKLFLILIISLIFGVIVPLLFMLFLSIYVFYVAIVSVFVLIICFVALIVITSKFIGL